MTQPERLSGPLLPKPLPRREAQADPDVFAQIQRLDIENAYVFERAVERDFRNRVEFCYLWARTVRVHVVDEFLALRDEAMRDRPLKLIEAIDECRIDAAALIVYDFASLSIDPGKLFDVMLELREPVKGLPRGIPLLIAGTGVVELPVVT